MNCLRCGSTMIFKKFCDYGGYFSGWKCICCGEIIDEVPEILQWRKRKQEWEKTLFDHVGKEGRIKPNLNT